MTRIPPAPADTVAATSRRRFLRMTFLGGLAEYLFPRRTWDAAARFRAGNVATFVRGGAPVRFEAYQGAAAMWLVHLDAADDAPNGSGGEDGLVALRDACTHLGCAIPWREQFDYQGVRGWFRCPCHAATFARAGQRMLGPAPRGLDTYRVEITADDTVFMDRAAVV